MNIGSLVVTVGAKIDGFERAMGDVSKQIGSVVRDADKAFSGFDKLGSKLTGFGTTLTAALTVPLAGFGFAAVKSAADLEALKLGLTAVTGSSKEAERQFLALREVARLPGLGLEEAVRGATNLQALGFSAEQSQRILLTFGNALASVGRGRDDLEEVIRQLGQLGARGQVTADNLRPIIERVPQVAAIIKREFGAEALSDPAKRFQELGVSSEQFIETLTKELGKLPKVTGGIKNDLENVTDSIKIAFADIGKSIAPLVKTGIDVLVPLIEGAVKAFTTLPEPVQQAAIAFAGILAAVGPIALAIGGTIKAFATISAAVTATSGVLIPFAVSALPKVTAAFTTLATVTIPAAIRALVTFALTTIPSAIAQIGLLSQAMLTQAGTSIATFATATVPAATASLLTFARTGVAAAIAGLITLVTTAIPAAVGAFTTLSATTIPAVIASLINLARTGIASALTGLASLGTAVLPAVIGTLSTLGVAALAAGAAFAGWHLGKWAYEQIPGVKALGDTIGSLLLMIPGVESAFLRLTGATKAQDDATATLEKNVATLEKTLASKGIVVDRTGLSLEQYAQRLNTAARQSGAFSGAQSAVKVSIEEIQKAQKAANKELEHAQKVLAETRRLSVIGAASQQDVARAIEAVRQASAKAHPELHQVGAKTKDLAQAFSLLQLTNVAKEARDLTQALVDLKKSGDFAKLSAEEQARVTKLVEQAQFAATRQTISLNEAMAKLFVSMRQTSMEANEFALNIEVAERALEALNKEAVVALTTPLHGTLELQGVEAAEAAGKVAILKDAYKTLNIQSSAELQKLAAEGQKAYEQIANDATSSAQDRLKAELAALKASIEAHRAAGEAITEADRKRLAELEKLTGQSVAKQKTLWQQLADAIKSIGQNAVRGLSDILVGGVLFGGISKQNAQLDKEAAALKASLAERTAEWEKYQVDVAAQLVMLREKHAADLAQQEADLKASLAEKEAEYKAYAESVEQQIARIQETNAGKAAEEIAELQQSLAEKRAEYEEYRTEVYQNIDEIRAKHAQALAEELADLQDSLRDRREAYEDAVADINTKLSHIGVDTENAIGDETRETQRGIADRQKQFDREEQDILKRISELEKENKSSNKKQIADLKTSLNRKREDLAEYIRRAKEDLADFTEEHRLQAERQTAALQTELAIQKREYDEFVQDNLKQVDSVTTKHKTQVDQQTKDLLEGLAKREKELAEYQKSVEVQIDAITKKYNEASKTEEAELRTTLRAREEEVAKYRANIEQQLENLRIQSAAKLAAEERDLKDSLAAKEREYNSYKQGVLADLDEIKEKHVSVWGEIGNLAKSVIGQMATAFSDLAIKTIGGELFGKLKELITMIPGIGEALGGLISKIPGLTTPTVPTVPTTGGGTGGTGGTGTGGGGGFPGGATGVGAGIGALVGGPVGAAVGAAIGAAVDLTVALANVFGGMRRETTLNAIEENTRFGMIFTATLTDQAVRFFPSIDTTARWAASNGATLQDISNNLVSAVSFPLLQIRDYVSGGAASVLTEIRDITQQISWDLMEHIAFALGETRDRITELARFFLTGGQAIAPVAAVAPTAPIAPHDVSADLTAALQPHLLKIVNSQYDLIETLKVPIFNRLTDIYNEIKYLAFASAAMLAPLPFAPAGIPGGSRTIIIHTHVDLNGREIADAVTEYLDDNGLTR